MRQGHARAAPTASARNRRSSHPASRDGRRAAAHARSGFVAARPVYFCLRVAGPHLESPPFAAAALSVRAAAAMVRRRHAEPGAARRSICRSASRGTRRPRSLTDALVAGSSGLANYPMTIGPRALRERRSPRGSRAGTDSRARSGDGGPARAREPRGALRVRADGDRRSPRGRASVLMPNPVLSDLRRRGAARRRRAVLRQCASPRRIRAGVARGAGRRSGRARNSSTSARRTIRPDA